ncbi:MAG: pseudouridine synthase [Thiothrix sp.]
MKSTMRLDQFVSQATGISRATAQTLIRSKQVQVNGVAVIQPATHVATAASVTVDGATISLPGAIYLMLHKPRDVISATHDPAQRTVLDLIDHPHRHTLHVVGRLDKDTTGLLLLSNDGAWSHRLMSPKYHVPKTYLATLAEPLSAAAAAQLLAGVQLHGEQGLSVANALETLSAYQARITIREGKYHQVKRMFAAVGNRVTGLHRESIGSLPLDAALPAGRWRALTAQELAYLNHTFGENR